MIRYLKVIYRRGEVFFRLLRLHIFDFLYSLKNNNYLCMPENKGSLESHILLLVHQLEKGLSHKNGSRMFGAEKAKALSIYTNKYIQKYGISFVSKLSINTLYEYLKSENSTKDKVLRSEISTIIHNYKDLIQDGFAGVKEINPPESFDKKYIESFFLSRGSVRNYNSIPISKQELKEIYRFASYTPSACNRQASRIYFFDDRAKMDAIIDNQLGDQGWVRNATALFVITNKASYFNGDYERYQPYIDGGLFSMNFIMGLHLNGIASCFKMYVREPKRDKEFRKITNIPRDEIPIVVIAAGHYKNEVHYSTKSVRYIQNII